MPSLARRPLSSIFRLPMQSHDPFELRRAIKVLNVDLFANPLAMQGLWFATCLHSLSPTQDRSQAKLPPSIDFQCRANHPDATAQHIDAPPPGEASEG